MKINKTDYLKILSFVLFTSFFFSCTTIKIQEKDAFDAKKTVSAVDFKQKGIDIEELYISSDDTTKIRAWYLKQENSKGTVLYFGGNGFLLAIAGDIIGCIFEQGMDVFAFDYRGYGKSSGNPTIQGLKLDAQAVYDYLVKKRNVNPEQLIVHGHSMGTFFSLFTVNNNESKGLVLESPITDAEDLTNRLVPSLVKPFVLFEIDDALRQESNLKQIEKLQIPVLIITGANDNITPKEMAEVLFEKAETQDKKLYIIEKGGHNDLPLKIEYKKELARFYSKILKDDRPTKNK